MRKLILLGVVAITAMFSAPADAQISVNVNIGSRPRYEPVRYVNTGYYYGPVARPVYINNVYKVKHHKYKNYRPIRTRYISRPVVYRPVYYKNNHGPRRSYHKGKSHGRDRGIERIVGPRRRR